MLTPTHKLKREIMRTAHQSDPETFPDEPLETAEQIDEAYSCFVDSGYRHEYESEFRSGQVETDLPCEYDRRLSRHYEAKAVAAQTAEGNWIGWTYWFGGGKHGEPEAIEWIEHAYELKCTEEEKVVVVRKFERLSPEGT